MWWSGYQNLSSCYWSDLNYHRLTFKYNCCSKSLSRQSWWKYRSHVSAHRTAVCRLIILNSINVRSVSGGRSKRVCTYNVIIRTNLIGWLNQFDWLVEKQNKKYLFIIIRVSFVIYLPLLRFQTSSQVKGFMIKRCGSETGHWLEKMDFKIKKRQSEVLG